MKRFAVLAFALALMGPTCVFQTPPPPPVDVPPPLPPTEATGQLQVFDAAGNPLTDNVVRKEHNIGDDTCPDPFDPLTVQFPPGFENAAIPPTTDAPWLNLPDAITPNVPFEMEFNCNIFDFSNHSEIGQVFLDFSAYAAEHPGMEHLAGTEKGGTFIVVTDTCNGPCVADFALPYICSSDCSQIEYIVLQEPEPETERKKE